MERIRNYAKLLVTSGVCLQKDQALVIRASTDVAEFVKIVVEEAYKLGASDVEVFFTADGVTHAKYQGAPLATLENGQVWFADAMMHYANKNACFLSLASPAPDLLGDVDSAKIAAAMKGTAKVMKPYREKSMSNAVRWNVAAVPCNAWAKKLFPELSSEAGIQRLWDLILSCAHADGADPVLDWNKHTDTLQVNRQKLNALKLSEIHFQSVSSGTDLTLGIVDEGLWGGGISLGQDGVIFAPNIPSEEIFIAPHRNKISGRVVASMPLNYSGNLIEGFEMTYAEGRVCNYSAVKGEAILKSIFELDEGAQSIGEIALVPHSSPIRKTGILFYTTLFDENASCHLAFGNGYPVSVGGEDRRPETLLAKGLNSSSAHVDFMFGTADMEVTGTCANGEKIVIMKNGEFVL